MNWTEDLMQRARHYDRFQISVDGQIWTVDQRQHPLTFTNPFGRQEKFDTPEQIGNALQSWYENPVIIVL